MESFAPAIQEPFFADRTNLSRERGYFVIAHHSFNKSLCSISI